MAGGQYAKIFDPIKIGKVEIKNRIAMAPMGITGLCTLEGAFGQRAVDYYLERARGGTGLIITSLTKVENEIEKRQLPSIPFISVNPAHFVQTASEMTEGVHAYGAKIFLQMTGGVGRVGNQNRQLTRSVAPSAIPNYWNPSITCRELTTEEVERLVRAFGEAAKTAVKAGFDGVEIHAVHEGYLIDQFAIALFNRRTDKYGGDLRGRLTLATEIVKEIKKEAGPDFPVQLRYSIKSFIKDWRQGGLPGEEFKEAGRDTEEGLQAAKILEEAGYDAFNADAGSYDAWYWAHPPLYQAHGCYLSLTEKLKKVVKVPVIVAGRMELPELAAAALADGKADMVALGRGLLADPHWGNKVLEGKIKKIRPCLACHDGCLGRMALGRPLSCAVNPACGREKDYALQPALEKKKVTVIGGGVAGMEAARVAAIRGHRVSLYEKSGKLGGHLNEVSVPSFKKDAGRLLRWYETELAERDHIKVYLNREASKEAVLKENPGVVIVATGSKPVFPDVPGINAKTVVTASDLLLGKRRVKGPSIVIGGGLTGCETALWLAQQGHPVTVVEMLPEPMCAGIPVPHANKIMLLDLLKFHKVDIRTHTSLLAVTDNGVELIDTAFHRSILPAGNVVLAVGLEPDQNIFLSLAGKIPDIYLIGDARQPRNIMQAVWDAYEVARNI